MRTARTTVSLAARAFVAFAALLACVAASGCSSGPSPGAPEPTVIGQVSSALTNGTACTSSAACNSGFCTGNPPLCAPCTADSTCPTNNYCNGGVCTAKKANGAGCTAATASQCASAFCNGLNKCANCGGFATCDDGKPCTNDTCVAGACQHTAAATACDDGNYYCTSGDACNAGGTCTGTNCANGTTCPGGACQTGACCTGCSNGGACVALGAESAAQCGAAGAVCTSCVDGNPCTTDACSATGACQNANVSNGTACPGGACQSGACCTGCMNGGACVALGAESATQCGSGAAACTSCNDGNTCTTDTCSATGACQHANAANGTACAGGACQSGACCTGCSNGGACVALGSESGTQCGAAGAVCTSCNDGNPCTTDTCSATGACQHANAANGTACAGGVCQSGACCTGCMNGAACVALGSESATQCGAGGAACGGCDDGNPCTVDACSGAGACTHTAGNAGTQCRASAGACDVAETCNGTSTTCPADGFSGAATVCRAKAGECDVAENCTGSSALCPSDAYTAFQAACTDDGNACTSDYCSGIAATCSHPTLASCSHGLTVTYYDNIDFTGPTVNRIDPIINFTTWGSPDPAIASTTFSGRWTGQVLADKSETYTFETEADDGVRLWVNNVLLVNNWVDQGMTKVPGTIALTAGQRYDIKLDYYQNGGGAGLNLRWSSPTTPYALIPTDHLFAGGDAGLGGLAYNSGADNGTGDPYVVWQISSTPGTAPVNVSSSSANNWGLGSTVMMVPAFSPDGNKLVFIDGDSAGGAGWRKGLSIFDFNETAKAFSNRRSLRNTWPTGDVMKWPVWEPDSRSVVFQTSTPTELCTQCDGKTGYRYGNMAPTNYYGAPGTLWSVDSSNPATAVQLTQLNTGERAADATKSYQPTALPVSAGGYRWVVFTSTRPYGNVLNPPGTSTSCDASQLWVAALDDVTSGAADRSHPAFWLPNQIYGDPSQPNYINERAYWVLDPCKPAGTGAGSVCVTDDDCCNAPAQAACRIDQPATTPPTRHCVSVNRNACSADGGSCGVDADCCGFPSSHCVTGVCAPPAPVPNYQNGVFTRDYVGDCPPSTSAVWRFFDWQTTTPGDSKIVFSAQTSDTDSGLASAPTVEFGTASGPATVGWVGEDVGQALTDQSMRSQKYLRITMNLTASSDGTAAPTLLDWRQSYSCIADQ